MRSFENLRWYTCGLYGCDDDDCNVCVCVCVCVRALSGRKGGELASAVHAYGKTGDPNMRALVQHILSLVSHPILNFLYRWIYDGELEDTYHEVSTTCLLTHTHTQTY